MRAQCSALHLWRVGELLLCDDVLIRDEVHTVAHGCDEANVSDGVDCKKLLLWDLLV